VTGALRFASRPLANSHGRARVIASALPFSPHPLFSVVRCVAGHKSGRTHWRAQDCHTGDSEHCLIDSRDGRRGRMPRMGRRSPGCSCRGAGESKLLQPENERKGSSLAWHVLPKLSSSGRSLRALRSAQRRYPRSKSHRRFVRTWCSLSPIVRCLARSNMVSELEATEADN
jgi:hypothetical protein